MTNIKLSILDQSIVHKGQTPQEALLQTIAVARRAEQLGYSRFWVSEHHNSIFIAGSSPEMLLMRLGVETEHIRLGSGGVMLPNHSALKVAENFRMLEALYPGRIDLGMGRAPGSDRVTAQVLNPANNFSEESYIRQLDHLQRFFNDEAQTQFGNLLAVPQARTSPEQWILSSSGGSSMIAARFGLGLAVARFINGQVSPDVVQVYKKNFTASAEMPTPKTMLSVAAVCADTEEQAALLRKFADYMFVQFEKGRFDIVPDLKMVAAYEFSPSEQERVAYNSGRIVSGTPEQVKEQLEKMAQDFETDELMLTNMAPGIENRLRSWELLSEAFALAPVATV